MILGSLSAWEAEKYIYPAAFDTAMQFFMQHELAFPTPGKYSIDGDRIFVSVHEGQTEPAFMRFFETHQAYVDIHVVFSGQERHLFFPGPPVASPVEGQLAKDDVAFYPHPERVHSVDVRQGQYVIYLPWEMHCPMCAAACPSKVQKAVAKIHRSCL